MQKLTKNAQIVLKKRYLLKNSKGKLIETPEQMFSRVAKAIAKNSKQWLIDLQKKEQDKNNIPSLKIKYNKVFGYYIEVTKAHGDKVPDYFIRKQTLVNAERYFTSELKDFEDTILSSNENLLEVQQSVHLVSVLINKLLFFL